MDTNRFCFVAIVKNESHVIKRCIDSIANVATSYLICDTGSTDGTPEIIESYMKEKGIAGEVIHKEWKNFGYNKSYLLEQAYTHGKANNAKYLIWHDADEVFLKDISDLTSYLTKDDADELYNWLEERSEPIIFIKTIFQDLHYGRWNIVKNNQLYKWMAPKHEWLLGTNDNRSVNYDKFILYARKEGSASRDPERCQKDSKLFIDYINENGGPDQCPREVFYLAQEYEPFDKEKAIEWYIMRTKLNNGFYQERYISYLRLGRLHNTEADKIKYWSAGYNFIPHRLECLYEIMKYYKDKEDWQNAYKWGCLASENRNINNEDLFVEHLTYTYNFDLDFSVVAYYSGRHQMASDINQRNMIRNKGQAGIDRLVSNQKFFEDKMEANGMIKLCPEQRIVDAKPIIYQSHPSVDGIIYPPTFFEQSRFSSDIRPTVIIVDNFYPNADEIRQMALEQDFNVKGNYPSYRTKSFATDEIKNRFETIIGKKITYWPDGYNGAFQYTTAENKSWIHRDKTDYSAIIFLSKDPIPDSGTVLYKHKASGLQYAKNDSEENLLNQDSNNMDAWYRHTVIGNMYNRCILFNGRHSHMSDNYFGIDKYTGRLFQTFFFDTTK